MCTKSGMKRLYQLPHRMNIHYNLDSAFSIIIYKLLPAAFNCYYDYHHHRHHDYTIVYDYEYTNVKDGSDRITTKVHIV